MKWIKRRGKTGTTEHLGALLFVFVNEQVLTALRIPRIIEPFQKGETPTFIQHIDSGLDILKTDARAMLVFSG